MNWFRRLEDIPGIRHAPLVEVAPEDLPGRGFEPTTVAVVEYRPAYVQDGLSWPSLGDPNTQTELTPAEQHLGPIHDTRIPNDVVIRRLSESLELPATARAYHDILSRGVGTFWHKRRRSQPGALNALEHFALLDVQLFRRVPDALRVERGQAPGIVPHSLETLFALYFSEGLLTEAQAVAHEAEQYATGSARPSGSGTSRIETVLHALRVEDGLA